MKKLQYGRSMVEMLGVLAIIGVLSVGAIAGYQKAMTKYKLNKHSEQINQIVNGVIEHSKQFRISDIAEETTNAIPLVPFYKKLNFIPKEMYTSDENYLKDIFNNEVYIYQYYNQLRQGIRFTINTNDQKDVCFNFLNIVKSVKENIEAVRIVDYSQDADHGNWLDWHGDKFCDSSKNCLKNLKIENYSDVCTFCKKGKSCYMYIQIDI